MKTHLLTMLGAVAILAIAQPSSATEEIEWLVEYATPVRDQAIGVAADSDHYAVVGFTEGALEDFSLGDQDAFISLLDHDGNELWMQQFGTNGLDGPSNVAIDSSGITVGGVTQGNLANLPGFPRGDDDAFVRRYDFDGNVLWTDQFGGPSRDGISAVAADERGIWATGRLNFGQSCVLRRYDHEGNLIWERLFGTSAHDIALGVTLDPNGVTVVGWTDGTFFPGQTPPAAFGTPDVFVRRYDLDGNELWTRQFGTNEEDQGRAIAADPNGLTVAAFTRGSFPGFTNAGKQDAVVRRYDFEGNELWTRQFGTSGDDIGWGVSATSNDVAITGYVGGALPGQIHAGEIDVYLRRYDLSGTELLTVQFGSQGPDAGVDIVADPRGVVIAGAINRDAFAARITTGPSPVSVSIDIKPWSRRNVINPRARGGIWVALLSDGEFDPLQVDIPTVRFGPNEAGSKRYRIRDVDRDGSKDLLLRFRIPETGITCEDTDATLIGETFEGLSIAGTDVIKTVGCRRR